MTKIIGAFCLIFSMSFESVATSRIDRSAIASEMKELGDEGYDCKMTRIKPTENDENSDYEYKVQLDCIHQSKPKRFFIVSYDITGSPRARCRNEIATKIEEIFVKKSAPSTESGS